MNEPIQGAGAKRGRGRVRVVEGEQKALAELKERLRRLRAERRLSMTALERRAGMGHTTVSRALNGSTLPSAAFLFRGVDW